MTIDKKKAFEIERALFIFLSENKDNLTHEEIATIMSMIAILRK